MASHEIKLTIKNLAGELYPIVRIDPHEIDVRDGEKLQNHIKNNLRRRDRELFNIHPARMTLTRLDDKTWDMASYPLTDEMLFILVDPKFMVNLHGSSGSFPLNFPEHNPSDTIQMTENELKQVAHQQYPHQFRDLSIFRLVRDTERTFRKPLNSGEQVAYIIGDVEEIKTPDEEFDSLIRNYRNAYDINSWNKERFLIDLEHYLQSSETIQDIGEEKIIEEVMREYGERRRQGEQSLPLCKVLLKYLPFGELHRHLISVYNKHRNDLPDKEKDIFRMLLTMLQQQSSSRFGGKKRSRSKKSIRKNKSKKITKKITKKISKRKSKSKKNKKSIRRKL